MIGAAGLLLCRLRSVSSVCSVPRSELTFVRATLSSHYRCTSVSLCCLVPSLLSCLIIMGPLGLYMRTLQLNVSYLLNRCGSCRALGTIPISYRSMGLVSAIVP